MPVRLQLVLVNFSAERVAVNSEHLRRLGLIAFRSFQHAFDKFLFELTDGFFEQNSAVDHLSYQPFELILHARTLHDEEYVPLALLLAAIATFGPMFRCNLQSNSWPTRMRYASRYFARVAATTSGGNSGPGGLLGQ
jgi:hypothetical protein